MPTSDMKTVKGLNIAIIVLSALSAAMFLAFAALTAIGVDYMSRTDMYSLLAYELQSDLYGSAYLPYATDAAMATTSLLLGFVILMFVWCFLCSIVSLVAGILSVRNAQIPQKLGAAFVWTIIAAAGAFLSGRMITMALLIVSAVFIHRVRKTDAPAYTQYTNYQPAYAYTAQPDQAAQPAYAYAPQPVQQPVVQPTAQPEQSVVQPTAQPEQSE